MPKLRSVLLLLVILLPLSVAAAQPPAPDPTAVSPREALTILAGRQLLPTRDTAQEAMVDADSWLKKPATTAALDVAGSIAYASERSGGSDIFTQAAAGGDAQALVTGSARDLTPAWSPAGRQVLFVSDRDGDFDVYVRRADGRIRNLTDNTADDLHPAWSPDGRRVIFSSSRGGDRFQIYTMNSDGGDVRRVAAIAGNHALAPRYSPNGARIAFMRASRLTPSCTWNWDVWLMNADGRDQRRVTTQLGGDLYPDWTPDGRIVYSSCRNLLDADLYVVNPDTGVEDRLNKWAFSDELNAAYAPDGNHLAFSSDVEGNQEIYVAVLSEEKAYNLTQNGAADVTPDWTDPQAPPPPTYTISGDVIDEDGRPLAGVTVSDDAGHTAVTDGQGRYRLTGLLAGGYRLSAARRGVAFVPPFQHVAVPPDATAEPFVGRSCARATATTPIMMVTGWSGSVGTTQLGEDGQLRYFVDFQDGFTGHLTRHGYVEGCNLFYATDTSPYLSLYGRDGERSNATVLRDNLCAAYPLAAQAIPNWSGAFTLIGHSYGGLRARAVVENRDLYERDAANGRLGAACAGTPNRVRVDNIFTLGTPHGGEWGLLPFDLVIGLEALLGDTTPALDPELPAIWEMLPPVRVVQNLLNSQPPGVRYYLLGGDAREQMLDPDWGWLVSLLVLGWPYDTVRVEANDLAVRRDSAHAIAQFPYNLRYGDVRTVDTPDLHGNLPGIGLRSYVNPNTTFEAAVCAAMGLPTCAGAALTAVPAAPAQGPGVMETLDQLAEPRVQQGGALQDVAAGALAAGETRSGAFTLDGAGPTQVMLAWSAGDLALTLTDPQGRPVDDATDGVTFVLLDGGLGPTALYHLAAPAAGEWTYTIRAGDLDRAAAYRLAVALPSPIGITAELPEHAAHGAAVPLQATVAYEATPLPDVEITARIGRPDGRVETLDLRDDGRSGDGAAGDGRFGLVYAATDVGGVYSVLVTAAGSHAGEPFTRTTTAYFTVAPDTARLSGSYADRPVAGGVPGLYAALAVDVGVDVARPGVYTLTADLFAGDDWVAQSTRTLTLEAGQRTVALLFDGAALRAAGHDGRYAVRNVLLLDESEVTVLIEKADNVWRTAAYRAADFGVAQRVFLPQVVGAR